MPVPGSLFHSFSIFNIYAHNRLAFLSIFIFRTADAIKSVDICCWFVWFDIITHTNSITHTHNIPFWGLFTFCDIYSQKHRSCADCKYFWFQQWMKHLVDENARPESRRIHAFDFFFHCVFGMAHKRPLECSAASVRLICSLFEWPQNAVVLPLHCCKTNAFGLEASCFVAFRTFWSGISIGIYVVQPVHSLTVRIRLTARDSFVSYSTPTPRSSW